MAQTRRVIRTTKIYCPRWYSGNLFFLILSLIIWLPVGILLLMKNVSMTKGNSRFYLHYHGSWNWLYFWGVLFFPISIILFLIKGVDVIEEETIVEEETLIIDRY
jgi:hypothetical protein